MMRYRVLTTFFLLFYTLLGIAQCELNAITNTSSNFDIEIKGIPIQNIPLTVSFQGVHSTDSLTVVSPGRKPTVFLNKNGEFHFQPTQSGNYTFSVGKQKKHVFIRVMPLWYSVVPPLIAILFAMLFKEVLTALLIGLFSGTAAIVWYGSETSFIGSMGKGLLDIVDNRIITTIADTGHASVIVFSLLIGAVVQLIRKNGGMHGLVSRLARKVTTPRKGLFLTWLLGILIFFDDYANTLVVGNTVRPVTDRLKISREKLAYIVDSTAAPVACLAFVTTWIGVELSYIQEGLNQLPTEISPYQLFLQSLPYRFYPFLTLFFILLVIFQQRDFGPMYQAERKAREEGVEHTTESTDLQQNISHWINAVIPVTIIIFGTFAGLVVTGYESALWSDENITFVRKLSITIGASDAFKALLWSSMVAVLVAFLMSVGQKLLTLRQASEAIVDGFRAMLSAIVILILAWSLATITQELHTAEFLSGMLASLEAMPGLLPAITFILAALVAFSTGSSWGTMAILYPLLMPVTWKIGVMAGMPEAEIVVLLSQMIAGILAGAVMGDHCSPISDTTILSSLASNCDHIEHVRTQMPYALTVGGVALVFCLVPLIWNVSPWLTYPLAAAFLYFALRIFGRKVDF
ncbi:MAG: Na+/H+ antiporter NhaC family protein [Salinivirgaceae bacterium]|jgi:Na+/H+ antiporter NhaC|nr:Na+/H+ antiporter NhaC family protein [Salinivirgaceae bacterium]